MFNTCMYGFLKKLFEAESRNIIEGKHIKDSQIETRHIKIMKLLKVNYQVIYGKK